MGDAAVLLEVDDLRTYFHTDEGLVKAVDGASFDVRLGETLGIVGESGCGKTVTALSILQLIRPPRGRIEGGRITYYRNASANDSVDITSLRPQGIDMRHIRGNEIAMIFQEPMASLNPLFSIGQQIMEGVRLHEGATKEQARARAIELLNQVGIAGAAQRVDDYPHQFSGGMQQRAMIASGLACNPSLLIADEPTTALDVTIEAQILELLQDLQHDLGMSVVIITHDLGVIAEVTDRVVVMYAGKAVERANTDDLFFSAAHPYTMGLLESMPRIGRRKKLTPIAGSVPDLRALPAGCAFEPRCSRALPVCSEREPPLYTVGNGHSAKCWLLEKTRLEQQK